METLHQEKTIDRVLAGRIPVLYPTILSGEGKKMTKEEKEDLSRLVDDDRYAGETSTNKEVPGTGTSLGNNDGTQTMPDSDDASEATTFDNFFGEWRPTYLS